MATVSATAASPVINPRPPYNPVSDFTPIIDIAATPNVIALHLAFPAKDDKGFVKDLVLPGAVSGEPDSAGFGVAGGSDLPLVAGS